MDTLDCQILLAVQQNGRISNAEIARNLGVAPSTVLERIRRLEESGAIKGYKARLKPQALGLGIQGLVFVTLDRHDRECIEDFEKGIQNVDRVRACYHVTGRFDYLLHVGAKDLNALGALVKERIASITGIGKAETFLVLSEIKEDQGWPICLDGIEPVKSGVHSKSGNGKS